MSAARITAALRRLLGLSFAPPVRSFARTRTANRFRPMLEAVEDRLTPTPVVTVATIAGATEGSGVHFRFTRSDTTGSLGVNFAFGGTATRFTDYDDLDGPLATTVNFLANSATADFYVPTTNDSTSEPTETITVAIQAHSSYTVGTPASASADLLDNDAQVVTVVTQSNTLEGSAGSYLFTRTGDLSSSLTANYTVSGTGTATSGTDYTAFGTSVTFAANAATATKTVSTLTDNAIEGNETVVIALASGSGYSVGTPSSATLTISDATSEVTVANVSDTSEGGTAGTIRFTRTGSYLSGTLTVSYSVGGTAESGTDYTALSGTVTFAANASTADVSVFAVNDSAAEYVEWVIVSIQDGTNYAVSENFTAAVSIADNETPLVWIRSGRDALENVTAGQFWATRLGDLSSALTVNIVVSGTATSGTDFTALGTTLSFAAYEPYAVLDVDALADSSYDPDETVVVTLQTGTGYLLDTPYSATINIKDTIPMVTIEKITDAWEDGREGRFRLQRTGDLSNSLTVSYAISGSATEGDDYEELFGTVEFAAGESEVEVVITPVDDTDSDPGETITLTIQTATGYVVGTPSAASLTVVDNETPLVTVTKIADAIEGGNNGTFRFTRTGDTSSSLTISYTVAGTATSGTDYTALSGSTTFAINQAAVDVVVLLISDVLVEDTETVVVQVNSGTLYGAAPDAIDVVNIVDDDTNAGVIGGGVWMDDDDSDGVWSNGEVASVGWAVTLRDEFGGRLMETLTNASGLYEFRGLMNGTYFVTLSPPLLYWFTAYQAGTDESIDSDIDTLTGSSRPVTLTTGSVADLLVGAGFAPTAAPDAPSSGTIIVTFTYPDSGALGPSSSLKVAKWADAFEVANPLALAEVQKIRIKGPNAQSYDFIDRDKDRFNVRVYDLQKYNDPNVDTIDTVLTTNSGTGSPYNETDNTKIALHKIVHPDWVGWFWSDTQILVSNAADDKYTDANVGLDDKNYTENTTAGGAQQRENKKDGRTFKVGDRTHRIALGGKIVATYVTGATTATSEAVVKVDKTVKLQVNIMKDVAGNNGVPALARADAVDDLDRLNEIYARIGVKATYVINDSANPPNDLSKGLEPYDLKNGLTDFVQDGKTYKAIAMSPSEFQLAQDPSLQAKDPTDPKKRDDSVIHVYYVKWFTDDKTAAEAYGSALRPVFPNVVFIGRADRNYATLAHEVFHVLENLPLSKDNFTAGVDPTHYPYTQQNGKFSGLDKANLMITRTGAVRSNPPSELDSVRLNEEQQGRAFANAALAKNPT